ncbi:YhjD/YihY/BrkB family envelope integrity protein, partial [Planctomycetota bacterium]
NTGYITLLGVVFVIWAALALLSTIEKAFNNIWHVSRGRSFLHRMINYWALLTLGPLLLGLGIYISTRYSAIGQIQKTVISNAAPIVVSFLVAGIAFFLLYFVLPNTKVQAKSAIWGAAVAALVWVAAKGLFGYSVTELKMYRTVYGTLALFPITILWIYITWLIVLFGLQLTFTTQHLKTLDTAEITKAKKTEEYFIANDVTVINIVLEIAKAFEEDKAPISSYGLFSSLDMPAEFGEKIIERLVKGGIIAKVSEPREGFIPAKEPAKIRLSEVAEVVESAGFGQSKARQNKNVRKIALSVKGLLAEYNLQQILSGEEKSNT